MCLQSMASPNFPTYIFPFLLLTSAHRDRIVSKLTISQNSVFFLSTFEEQQQSDQFKILGFNNGLILCFLFGSLVYYVCDLVTNQWITIPGGRDKSPNRHHRNLTAGTGDIA